MDTFKGSGLIDVMSCLNGRILIQSLIFIPFVGDEVEERDDSAESVGTSPRFVGTSDGRISAFSSLSVSLLMTVSVTSVFVL